MSSVEKKKEMATKDLQPSIFYSHLSLQDWSLSLVVDSEVLTIFPSFEKSGEKLLIFLN